MYNTYTLYGRAISNGVKKPVQAVLPRWLHFQSPRRDAFHFHSPWRTVTCERTIDVDATIHALPDNESRFYEEPVRVHAGASHPTSGVKVFSSCWTFRRRSNEDIHGTGDIRNGLARQREEESRTKTRNNGGWIRKRTSVKSVDDLTACKGERKEKEIETEGEKTRDTEAL